MIVANFMEDEPRPEISALMGSILQVGGSIVDILKSPNENLGFIVKFLQENKNDNRLDSPPQETNG